MFSFLLGLSSSESSWGMTLQQLHRRITTTYQIWYLPLLSSITILECTSTIVSELLIRIGLMLLEPLVMCLNLNQWMRSKVSRLYLEQLSRTKPWKPIFGINSLLSLVGIFSTQTQPTNPEVRTSTTWCFGNIGLVIWDLILGFPVILTICVTMKNITA